MDRNWSLRGVQYKVCLVSLIIGIWPFLVGFGAPQWLIFTSKQVNGTDQDGSFGLWELCLEKSCTNNPLVGNPAIEDWFVCVVIFQTLALPLYFISILALILQNFTPRRWIRSLRVQRFRLALHRDSEVPEDLAFISGFLASLGIILFMIMTSDVISHNAFYSWGFGFSFTGAAVPVVVGVLMCKTHNLSGAHLIPQPRMVRNLSVRYRANDASQQERRRILPPMLST